MRRLVLNFKLWKFLTNLKLFQRQFQPPSLPHRAGFPRQPRVWHYPGRGLCQRSSLLALDQSGNDGKLEIQSNLNMNRHKLISRFGWLTWWPSMRSGVEPSHTTRSTAPSLRRCWTFSRMKRKASSGKSDRVRDKREKGKIYILRPRLFSAK